ncbi:PQQ-dependent sugar dehydrogenase [Pseudovibrio exalbescens]|uniref:Sorbosone dehydrogenase n=1 Tax=Pseudovibrio exalbescens TaxID=197461 RepID=A0A1U7JCI0_9HYPH|nr:PQQ-dependent sugar dehydrogenase [Pseudovibrio exalbescens]OKL42449.1 sorbosone dehydrogenase [Pseudovibrio exalbescens]
MARHTQCLIAGSILVNLGTVLPGQAKLPELAFQQTPSPQILAPDQRALQRAEGILNHIRIPDGFEISVFALVPNARHMAVSPSGRTLIVGTRWEDVWEISLDGDLEQVQDVQRFAPGITFDIPNGPCFAPDGDLYISERNRILVFPEYERAVQDGEVRAYEFVPQDDLIPVSEESGVHTARVCRIGPDNKFYVSLGQPYNVSPPAKQALYEETGIGGIVRFDRDGTNREVYTYGLRNAVGMDFNPANNELWFTDNQVDGMGDDIPPGELNRQTAPGQNFGFPWYGGGDTRTIPYKNAEVPALLVFPEVEMDAHAADLGMTFYRGSAFPEAYQGGIFNAQRGSWDRTEPIGARVMFTSVADDGSAAETSVFADGWIAEDGSYRGRPVDVAELPDGSLLVSDDTADVLYRITYDNSH